MLPISEWLNLLAQFRAAFDEVACQANRRLRSESVKDPLDGLNTFAWIVFERDTMWILTNAERYKRGLPPVQLKDIRRAEDLASGHSDYASKFALYCAEIAVGRVPSP